MDAFANICESLNLPRPVAEYQFAADIGRKWRCDWAWPEHKVALELEGGVWKGGRHQRPQGFIKDIDKYNDLAIHGFRLIRVTTRQMETGEVFMLLEKVLPVSKGGPSSCR